MEPATCPNCRAPMEPREIEGLYGRTVLIDVCGTCQGFWFDEKETLQLSPHGTMALFRVVAERQDGSRRPLGQHLPCPRCSLALSLTVDQQRTTRFQYFRCARGHGRFITFFQFLRARNFVRSLTPREVAELRARVRQIQCSNCGAGVSLDADMACPYCRAPISMLDPQQVQLALRELRDADACRHRVDPALPLTLMMERLKAERVFAEAARGATPSWTPGVGGPGGLVESGLALVMRWLR